MKKIILLPIALIIILLILTSLQVWFPYLDGFKEVAKFGLSWQVLLTILVSCLVLLFEEPIRNFLLEFNNIEAKGIKISRQQDKTDNSDMLPSKAVSDLILQRDYEWQNTLNLERQAASESIVQLSESTRTYIDQLNFESIKWRFKYADMFLAHRTKSVLKWFSESGPILAMNYESMVKTVIIDEAERAAIMNALLEVEFVEFNNDNIQSTNLGNTYLEYLKNIGYLI